MATVNSSILLIAMPDIFRGIGIDPLAPGNTNYLLWMILSFLVVTAVLVVSLGRLGDVYGRVRMYNLGFAVFTLGSTLLAVTWMTGTSAALLAHRHAGRAGHRRRDAVRELERDPHRRVPRPPARARARHQRRGRDRGVVRRPRPRRHPRADRVAARVPRLGADRRLRDRVGLSQARRPQPAPARAHRLARQRGLRARAHRGH